MVPGPAGWGGTLQIASNCFPHQTWSYRCKDYDLQVLGLTVRVLEDLPLLLNPLAILTLRWIMCELCHQQTIITITLVQIFLNWWLLCTFTICEMFTICTICRPGRDTPEPKGESLLQVKNSEGCLSSRKDRCVFEAFKYFLQSWAMQCCKFSFPIHPGNKAGMRKLLIDVDQYRLIWRFWFLPVCFTTLKSINE